MFGIDVKSIMMQDSAPDVSEKEIRDLVDAVLRGDRKKYGELFELFQPQVFSLAWNLTGNLDDTMDIIQECFLRAYRALSSWKGNAKFATWLHRIAVNTAIDFIRREAKHHDKRLEASQNEDDDEEIQNLCEGVERRTPLTELQRKELRKKIFTAVALLPDMQRRCFVLRYLGDMSTREAAEIFGCSEGTVKSHLYRAREFLKQALS